MVWPSLFSLLSSCCVVMDGYTYRYIPIQLLSRLQFNAGYWLEIALERYALDSNCGARKDLWEVESNSGLQTGEEHFVNYDTFVFLLSHNSCNSHPIFFDTILLALRSPLRSLKLSLSWRSTINYPIDDRYMITECIFSPHWPIAVFIFHRKFIFL